MQLIFFFQAAASRSCSSSLALMAELVSTGLTLANTAMDALLKLLAISDKVAAQLGVESDLDFIRDEFTMMQAFLNATDSAKRGKVMDTWVRQLRVMAHDVEDCLEESSLHLDRRPPSFWRLPHTLKDRHRVANEIRRLKARVQYISQRRKRYWFTGTNTHGGSIVAADDACWSKPLPVSVKKASLASLIRGGDRSSLRVISVWGGLRGKVSASVVREAYDDPETRRAFRCRAWIKVAHPFNLQEFMRTMVWKFYSNSIIQESSGTQSEAPTASTVIAGIEAMKKVAAAEEEPLMICEEFARQVNENRFLIVLDELSDAEVWDCIKACLPDRNNGSRVIVSTEHQGIAMLCPEQPIQVAEAEVDDQLLDGHPRVHLFFTKVTTAPRQLPASHYFSFVLSKLL